MKTYTISLVSCLLAPFFLQAKEKEKAAAVPDYSIDKVKYGEVVNDVAFDAKDVVGKVVVIEEWGVNCAPCIASLPEMQRLSSSGEKKGLIVLGFEAQGSAKEAINKVLKNARVKYPVFKGANLGVANQFIPHAAVFDATGKLTWHGNPNDDGFKRAVKDALKTVEK